MELLRYFGITDNVIGFSQDTTAANVGKEKGIFGRANDCRKLITDLEVKHYASPISGRNT